MVRLIIHFDNADDTQYNLRDYQSLHLQKWRLDIV